MNVDSSVVVHSRHPISGFADAIALGVADRRTPSWHGDIHKSVDLNGLLCVPYYREVVIWLEQRNDSEGSVDPSVLAPTRMIFMRPSAGPRGMGGLLHGSPSVLNHGVVASTRMISMQ